MVDDGRVFVGVHLHAENSDRLKPGLQRGIVRAGDLFGKKSIFPVVAGETITAKPGGILVVDFVVLRIVQSVACCASAAPLNSKLSKVWVRTIAANGRTADRPAGWLGTRLRERCGAGADRCSAPPAVGKSIEPVRLLARALTVPELRFASKR